MSLTTILSYPATLNTEALSDHLRLGFFAHFRPVHVVSGHFLGQEYQDERTLIYIKTSTPVRKDNRKDDYCDFEAIRPVLWQNHRNDSIIIEMREKGILTNVYEWSQELEKERKFNEFSITIRAVELLQRQDLEKQVNDMKFQLEEFKQNMLNLNIELQESKTVREKLQLDLHNAHQEIQQLKQRRPADDPPPLSPEEDNDIYIKRSKKRRSSTRQKLSDESAAEPSHARDTETSRAKKKLKKKN